MLNTKHIGIRLLLLAICLGTVGSIAAQGVQPIPPENFWRSEAVNLATEGDTVAPDIRKVRDAYWNNRFPFHAGPTVMGFPNGSAMFVPHFGPAPEFTQINAYQWIVGHFESFHVYQTSGRGGLYTEMNVRVQHVFGIHPQPGLAEGQLIDIALQGGAAIDSQGNRIDFLNTDYLPLIQPGHTYLMEVIPCQQLMKRDCGGFYLPARKWDITSGVVQPVDDFDVRFTATGKSHLAGTPASTIIPRFEQMLDQAADGGSK